MIRPELSPIGVIRSSLRQRSECPRQGGAGAPDAWVEIKPDFAEAAEGLVQGMEIILLTWLHESRRNVLKVHPGANPENPLKGVFATRSPDRPNPIGLHHTRILEVDEGGRLKVEGLEVLDGTPVLDIKPAG